TGHRPLFGPPDESKDAGLRVAEDADDRRRGTESRKSVCIPKPTDGARGWHLRMMPNSQAALTGLSPASRAATRPSPRLKSPTHFHEEPQQETLTLKGPGWVMEALVIASGGYCGIASVGLR